MHGVVVVDGLGSPRGVGFSGFYRLGFDARRGGG